MDFVLDLGEEQLLVIVYIWECISQSLYIFDILYIIFFFFKYRKKYLQNEKEITGIVID